MAAHPSPSAPSGGSHLYFAAPAGAVIGSTSGGKTRLRPGIDTRGERNDKAGTAGTAGCISLTYTT